MDTKDTMAHVGEFRGNIGDQSGQDGIGQCEGRRGKRKGRDQEDDLRHVDGGYSQDGKHVKWKHARGERGIVLTAAEASLDCKGGVSEAVFLHGPDERACDDRSVRTNSQAPGEDYMSSHGPDGNGSPSHQNSCGLSGRQTKSSESVRQLVEGPAGAAYSLPPSVDSDAKVASSGTKESGAQRMTSSSGGGQVAAQAPWACGRGPFTSWKGSNDEVQIFVKSYTEARSLVFRLKKTSSVGFLLAQIRKRTGVPATEQRLLFRGRQLAEEASLEHYGVEADCTLHLLSRLRSTSCPEVWSLVADIIDSIKCITALEQRAAAAAALASSPPAAAAAAAAREEQRLRAIALGKAKVGEERRGAGGVQGVQGDKEEELVEEEAAGPATAAAAAGGDRRELSGAQEGARVAGGNGGWVGGGGGATGADVNASELGTDADMWQADKEEEGAANERIQFVSRTFVDDSGAATHVTFADLGRGFGMCLLPSPPPQQLEWSQADASAGTVTATAAAAAATAAASGAAAVAAAAAAAADLTALARDPTSFVEAGAMGMGERQQQLHAESAEDAAAGCQPQQQVSQAQQVARVVDETHQNEPLTCPHPHPHSAAQSLSLALSLPHPELLPSHLPVPGGLRPAPGVLTALHWGPPQFATPQGQQTQMLPMSRGLDDAARMLLLPGVTPGHTLTGIANWLGVLPPGGGQAEDTAQAEAGLRRHAYAEHEALLQQQQALAAIAPPLAPGPVYYPPSLLDEARAPDAVARLPLPERAAPPPHRTAAAGAATYQRAAAIAADRADPRAADPRRAGGAWVEMRPRARPQARPQGRAQVDARVVPAVAAAAAAAAAAGEYRVPDWRSLVTHLRARAVDAAGGGELRIAAAPGGRRPGGGGDAAAHAAGQGKFYQYKIRGAIMMFFIKGLETLKSGATDAHLSLKLAEYTEAFRMAGGPKALVALLHAKDESHRLFAAATIRCFLDEEGMAAYMQDYPCPPGVARAILDYCGPLLMEICGLLDTCMPQHPLGAECLGALTRLLEKFESVHCNPHFNRTPDWVVRNLSPLLQKATAKLSASLQAVTALAAGVSDELTHPLQLADAKAFSAFAIPVCKAVPFCKSFDHVELGRASCHGQQRPAAPSAGGRSPLAPQPVGTRLRGGNAQAGGDGRHDGDPTVVSGQRRRGGSRAALPPGGGGHVRQGGSPQNQRCRMARQVAATGTNRKAAHPQQQQPQQPRIVGGSAGAREDSEMEIDGGGSGGGREECQGEGEGEGGCQGGTSCCSGQVSECMSPHSGSVPSGRSRRAAVQPRQQATAFNHHQQQRRHHAAGHSSSDERPHPPPLLQHSSSDPASGISQEGSTRGGFGSLDAECHTNQSLPAGGGSGSSPGLQQQQQQQQQQQEEEEGLPPDEGAVLDGHASRRRPSTSSAKTPPGARRTPPLRLLRNSWQQQQGSESASGSGGCLGSAAKWHHFEEPCDGQGADEQEEDQEEEEEEEEEPEPEEECERQRQGHPPAAVPTPAPAPAHAHHHHHHHHGRHARGAAEGQAHGGGGQGGAGEGHLDNKRIAGREREREWERGAHGGATPGSGRKKTRLGASASGAHEMQQQQLHSQEPQHHQQQQREQQQQQREQHGRRGARLLSASSLKRKAHAGAGGASAGKGAGAGAGGGFGQPGGGCGGSSIYQWLPALFFSLLSELDTCLAQNAALARRVFLLNEGGASAGGGSGAGVDRRGGAGAGGAAGDRAAVAAAAPSLASVAAIAKRRRKEEAAALQLLPEPLRACAPTILKGMHAIASLSPGMMAALLAMLRRHKGALNVMVANAHLWPEGDLSWLLDHRDLLEFDVKKRWVMSLLPEPSEDHADRHVILVTRGPTMLAESFEQIAYADAEILKEGLVVRFTDEEGAGAGVLREWFKLVGRELFNPDNALFAACPGDRQRFFPSATSQVNPGHLSYFRFAGRVIALALIHRVYMDVTFSSAFFKMLAGRAITWEDSADADPGLHASCQAILGMPAADVDNDLLGLTFTYSREELGQMKIFDLCPGGEHIKVTSANRRQFVDLLVKRCLVAPVAAQGSALADDFGELLEHGMSLPQFLKPLEPADLEALLYGEDHAIDVADWRAHSEYHGYQDCDPEIKLFWRVVEDMTTEERKRLLYFATAIMRLPSEGFAGLSCRFHIHMVHTDLTHLPTAHTCFHQLLLPPYNTYSLMRARLHTIIADHCLHGFGFV